MARRQPAEDQRRVGGWEQCLRGCGYVGAPASVANHIRKHHTNKES